MSRISYVQRGDGRLYVKGSPEDPGPPVNRFGTAPMFIGDAYYSNPTVSPVDGSVIDSRAKLREHNARNGVVDIGNDSGVREGRREHIPMPPMEKSVQDAYDALSAAETTLEGRPNVDHALDTMSKRGET